MKFQLYKERDFGSYISDTLLFFRNLWKTYFKNFVILNGALLAILCLIFYFILKDFFSEIFSSNLSTTPSIFNNQNIVIYGTLFLIGLIVAIIFTVITTAYPIIYLRLVDKANKENRLLIKGFGDDYETTEITASEIFNEIKREFWKIVGFGFLAMITFIPIFFIYFIISALLSIIVIGLPFLILGIGAAMTWITQSLYCYLNDEYNGYFDAMGEGWRILFSKFWHIAGASTAMLFIVNMLTGMISFIPYMMGIFITLSAGKSMYQAETATPWFIAFYVLNTVSSYLLVNLSYINQGMIYYSSREVEEHVESYSEIDSIGKNEE